MNIDEMNAFENMSSRQIRMYLKKYVPSDQKHIYNYAFQLVCSTGSVACVQNMLNEFPFIDTQNLEPFKAACRSGSNLVVEFLLSKMGKNCSDVFDALLETIQQNHLNIVLILLEHNQNFDVRAKNDLLFRTACDMEHWLIARTFAVMYPQYYEVTNDRVWKWSILDQQLQIKTAKIVDKIEECGICAERKCDVITPCAHSFCFECLSKWHLVKGDCPVCRTKLSHCSTMILRGSIRKCCAKT